MQWQIFRVDVIGHPRDAQSFLAEDQSSKSNAVQRRLIAEDLQDVVFADVDVAADVQRHHSRVLL